MRWLHLTDDDENFDVLHDDMDMQVQAYRVSEPRPMFDILTGVLLP